MVIVSINTTFGEAFFFNLSPTDIFNDFDNYLNIENSCFKTIDKNLLNNIKNKKTNLVLKLTNEGDIDEFGIQLLELLLKKYNIETDICMLIHDSFKLPKTDIKNYQLNNHLYLKSNETFKLNREKKLNVSVLKNKEYKFHLPIRRFRKHRILLLNKLFEKYPNFIDLNLVSYDINTESNKKELDFNASDNLKNYMLLNVAKFIDIDNLEDVNGYGFEYKQVYMKSYFTIVTETYFFEPYYYVSEKTFKPIAHMHPFIIFGRPGSLKYLKKYGFKTFHPFIDESYDLEENNNKRFEMVYDEIVKLNELTNEELDNIMDKITDILQHNQKTLLEMGGLHKMNLDLDEYIRKNIQKTLI
jgi:hypothetical protein